MKISSGSDYLRTAEVKSAVASHPHIETLANRFDQAHLAAQQDSSRQNKIRKAQAKKALMDAIAELTVPA